MDLNLAVVSFLNTIPLIDFFRSDGLPGVTMTKALPSELSAMLEQGTADVGLLPVVEVFRGKSPAIISQTCIGCQGSVDSVKLFWHGELSSVKTVWADRGSKTSVALTKVILAEMFGLAPEFQVIRPEPGIFPPQNGAVLVIGDLCFQYEKELAGKSGYSSFDLGQKWFELTGMPFVFAVWAVSENWLRKSDEKTIAFVSDILNKARNYGMARLGEISEREARAGKFGAFCEATPKAIEYYFRESLDYRLQASQVNGLREFHQLCMKHELVPQGPFSTLL